jgi:hypothetical protein
MCKLRVLIILKTITVDDFCLLVPFHTYVSLGGRSAPGLWLNDVMKVAQPHFMLELGKNAISKEFKTLLNYNKNHKRYIKIHLIISKLKRTLNYLIQKTKKKNF